jgi:hypothetical protein
MRWDMASCSDQQNQVSQLLICKKLAINARDPIS